LYHGKGIDEADKTRFLWRSGNEAYEDGHDKAGGPSEDRRPKVLRHLAGVSVKYGQPAALYAGNRIHRDGQRVMNRRGEGTREQSEKSAVARGAFPEHPQEECREQRSVHESKYELEHIQDVVEASRHVGADDGERDTENGGHAAYH
jgi:hypothetical protein